MILDDPELPGICGGPLRRVPRALARRRFRPGAGARRAGRAAARPAPAGHVGDARRRARRETAGRRAGDREPGPQLSRSISAIDERPAGVADRGRDGQGDPRRRWPRRPAACSPSCPASARSSAPPSGWQGRVGADIDIVPLYGQLDGKAQDAAIRPAPPGRRKVVLATSIAETSITIDGVRVVIDSGLSRLPRYEPATGLTRLETVRVSRASADQRAGRAGRTQPGVADPAVARRADGGAARLHAAGDPRGRPFRPAARLRRLRRRRSGEPRLPRSAAGAGACRGARAARRARRHRRRPGA